MAGIDDIDIEEHDILDNPAIRKIFPDISIVKDEINKYDYDDVPEIKQEEDDVTENYPKSTILTQSAINTTNKEPNSSNLHKTNNELVDIVLNNTNISKEVSFLDEIRSNISKPNILEDDVNDLLVPKLIVENIGSYLSQSEKYCKDCQIMYPCSSSLNEHILSGHSMETNEMNEVKIMKQSRYSYLVKKSRKNHNKKKVYQCSICKNIFSCSSNLCRHYRNIHKKKLTYKSKYKNKSKIIAYRKKSHNLGKIKPTETKLKTTDNPNNICTHCNKMFPDQNSLIVHIYETLEDKSHPTLRFDNKVMSGKNITFATHQIRRKQPSLASIRDKIIRSRNACLKKDSTFNNNLRQPTKRLKNTSTIKKVGKKESEERSVTSKTETNSVNVMDNLHPDIKERQDLIPVRLDATESESEGQKEDTSEILDDTFYVPLKKKSKQDDSNLFRISLRNRCNGLQKSNIGTENRTVQDIDNLEEMDDNSSHNIDTLTSESDSNDSTKNVSDGTEDVISKNLQFEKYKSFVLDSVIFKCFICNIHFLSSFIAKNHAKHFIRFLVNWKCPICKLIFKLRDQHLHLKQHEQSKPLNVCKFNESEILTLLYSCTKCAIHFTEDRYIDHYSKCGEDRIDSAYCKACDILVDQVGFKNHVEFHDEGKIISDFTFIASDILPGEEEEDSEPQKRVNNHNNSLIAESKRQRNKTHKNANENAELANVIYTKSNCSDLNSESESNVDMNDAKEILLYKCQSCRIAVHSYDKVIKHCQNHYCPVPISRLSVKKCDKCLVKFEGDDYKTHQKWHLNKSTFQMLTYDTAYFVSDNKTWTKHIFKSISQPIRDEIMGKSIYQPECRIKMDVIQAGPSHLTVYKCDQCGYFITSDTILKHVKNCTRSKDGEVCTKCGLAFVTPLMCKEHEEIHSRYDNINLNSYRMVLFNSKTHKNYNKTVLEAIKHYILYQCRSCDGIVDKLHRSSHRCNNNDLKKCSTCNLLFYKNDFNSHVMKHKKLSKFQVGNINVILFGDKNEEKPNQNVPTFIGMIYDYTLYKCKRCEVCVKQLQFTMRHSCSSYDEKRRCSKCKLLFPHRQYKIHVDMHGIDLDYDIKNIKIIIFDVKDGAVSIIQKPNETVSSIQKTSRRGRPRKSLDADPDIVTID